MEEIEPWLVMPLNDIGLTSNYYLSVHPHLDWNVHMKHLMSRLTIGIYSLHMVKHMRPLYVKRLLYMSNVERHLNYGMAAWGPMRSACNLKKLK